MRGDKRVTQDDEEVMKGEGAVGDSNLKYTFGDNAGAGNGTFFEVDEGNGKFTLKKDGNDAKVGINTTAPTKALQVAGDISASGHIHTSVVSGSPTGPLTLHSDGDNGANPAEIKLAAYSGVEYIALNSNVGDVDTYILGDTNSHLTSTPLFHANAGDETIGIGTTTHTAKFNVAGDLSTTTHITASGNISSSGNLISSRQFDKSNTTNNNLAQGDIIYQGGGSTTQGDIVYMKSDGQWGSAQADAASTSTTLLGIALGTDPDVDGVLLRGTYTLDHDVGDTQGVPLYLSDDTAGQATATAPSDDGDIIRIIGYNLGDDDEIWFDPDKTWVEHN